MAISYPQGQHFLELTGKSNAADVKITLIENAADTYKEGKKDWMYDNRNSIQAHGFQLDLVDLENYKLGQPGLLERLKTCDAIWLGGGNVYYLRWVLRETGADIMIKRLVMQGKVYGGGSAGAIIAGPTLKHFEVADNPKDAPEIIYEGLGLTSKVIVPHWANAKYGEIIKGVEESLQKDNFETIHITDEQAVIMDGDTLKIIP